MRADNNGGRAMSMHTRWLIVDCKHSWYVAEPWMLPSFPSLNNQEAVTRAAAVAILCQPEST
jgi:hypothetical protein